MIQMHGTPDRARIYGDIADRMERDPISEDLGRATVPMGRWFRGATWLKFNPQKEMTWVENPEGQMIALTPTQLSVYLSIKELSGSSTKVRSIAAGLKVSPSTISRAAVKLASFGLIAFLTGRGRYGGITAVLRQKADGLDRFRQLAKDKVRAWYAKANERVLRLKINVASRYSLKEIEEHGYLHVYVDIYGATLKATWTADDLVGIV